MKHKKETICVIILIILFLSIKISYLPTYEKHIHTYDAKAFDDYIELSRWFTGKNNNETLQTYQLSPLYPILLTPTIILPSITMLWVLFLNYIWIILSFIGIYFLTKKFLKPLPTIVISIIIALFLLPLGIMKRIPILLATCIFIWLIYFLINIDKEKKMYQQLQKLKGSLHE